MLPSFHFEHTWQVRFVDTDASGFAHFSSYVKIMEETEYAFLRSRGLSVVLKDAKGTIGFPRISAEFKIEIPLRFEDLVTVRLSLSEIDGKQITYDLTLINAQDQIAATGRLAVACCRFPEGKPPYAILMPSFVENALSGLAYTFYPEQN